MESKTDQFGIENEEVSSAGKGYNFTIQKLFPESSLLQIPSFAVSFYKNRKCRIFSLIKNETLVGNCLVSEYLFNAEIQFGPLVLSEAEMGFFLEQIASFYKKRMYGQLKICFPAGIQPETYISVFDKISGNYIVTKEEKGNWSSLLLELNRGIEMIQSGYSQNLQRNIKKAKQQGLYVKEINDEKDILRLGVIFDNLYQWRKVKSQWIDSPGTFLKWSLSPEIADKTIWFGIYNAANDLIGGMMLVKQGDSLFYQLGATDPEFRNLPILHLCFHEAILYAKEHNFLFFDFGGYDTDAKENDQTNNINLFKKQFGGEVVSNFPDIVVTLNPFINTVNNILMRLRHKLH